MTHGTATQRVPISLTTRILILVKCNLLLFRGALESINQITALRLGHNILESERTLAVSCGEVGRDLLWGEKALGSSWIMPFTSYTLVVCISQAGL